MLPDDKIKNIQNLYPTAKENTGFNARRPTQFKLSVVNLTPLLFLPPCLLIGLLEFYMNMTFGTKTTAAFVSIAFIALFIIFGVLAIAMLIKARGMVIRNSAHPLIVGLLYLGILIPIDYELAQQFINLYTKTNLYLALGAAAAAQLIVTILFIVLMQVLNHERKAAS